MREDTILEEKSLLLHPAGVKTTTSGCLCAESHMLGPQSYPHFTREKTETEEVRDVVKTSELMTRTGAKPFLYHLKLSVLLLWESEFAF